MFDLEGLGLLLIAKNLELSGTGAMPERVRERLLELGNADPKTLEWLKHYEGQPVGELLDLVMELLSQFRGRPIRQSRFTRLLGWLRQLFRSRP